MRVAPAPRLCIQARNGIEEMQERHRKECANERCIAAFQLRGLLKRQSKTKGKRGEHSQYDEALRKEAGSESSTKRAKLEASGKGRNPHADEVDSWSGRDAAAATIPSGRVASEPEVGKSKAETVRSSGVNIRAAVVVPGKVEKDSEATFRPRRPCNFSEEGDDHEVQDDYHEHQQSEEEEMAWQHHLSGCIDDQLMADAAQAAVEEAKARAKNSVADNLPDSIKVKEEVKGKPAVGTKATNLE